HRFQNTRPAERVDHVGRVAGLVEVVHRQRDVRVSAGDGSALEGQDFGAWIGFLQKVLEGLPGGSLLRELAADDESHIGDFLVARKQPGISTRGVVAPEKHLNVVQGVFRALDQCENRDRKSTRLNSSHVKISYAVFCLKKKNNTTRL